MQIVKTINESITPIKANNTRIAIFNPWVAGASTAPKHVAHADKILGEKIKVNKRINEFVFLILF